MIVRPVESKDIETISLLEKELYDNPWNKEDFLNEGNRFTYFFVLEEKDVLLGYYGVWIVSDYATILRVTVRKELQNKGLGKILMEDMLNRCVKMDVATIDLEVRISNQVAIALYHHFEFKDAGIRSNYYADGEDARLMFKQLKGSVNYEKVHVGN